MRKDNAVLQDFITLAVIEIWLTIFVYVASYHEHWPPQQVYLDKT